MRPQTKNAGIVTVGVLYFSLAIPAAGQQFTTLVRLQGKTGAHPVFGLAQGLDGYLYGTTDQPGTIFKMTPTGMVTILAKAGGDPRALVQDTDGNLYGATAKGGPQFSGGIFQVTPAGQVNDIFTFNLTGGAEPNTLIQAADGNLYGTASGGGANDGGVVFRYTPGGAETVLYSFCAQTNCSDGGDPSAGVIQATDGNFYGTTEGYGEPPSCEESCGTVFRITPAGQLTTLYNFCSQANCTDGAIPIAELVQASDGNLYGTTAYGGHSSSGLPMGSGVVFKITLDGSFERLHAFCSRPNCSDGNSPQGALIQGTDGNLYGTTTFGGNGSGLGTIFQITTGGKITTLHGFCPGTTRCHGCVPYDALLQATDGNFYGTTYGISGTAEKGTIFKLSTGLGPFVTMLQKSGSPGAPVTILGTDLTGATSVKLNGVPATSFSVNPTGSAIFTHVPAGATSGPIDVSTPGGTLVSNVAFVITR